MIAGLTPQKLALAVELASLPDSMRGYGHIKEDNVKAAKVKWEKLLAQWRKGEDADKREVA